MAIQIELRRDLGANWTSTDPILADGEIGIEKDASPVKFKIGDGTTIWSLLPYFSTGSSAVWGTITGTLSAQTDLQSALDDITALALAGL